MQDGVSAKLQEGGADQLEIVLVFTEWHYYDYFRQALTRQPGSWAQFIHDVEGRYAQPWGREINEQQGSKGQTNERGNKSTGFKLPFHSTCPDI